MKVYFIILFSILTFHIRAQNILNYNDESSKVSSARYLSYLKLDSSSNTIDKAIIKNNWIKNNEDVLNLGITKETYWIKIKIKNTSRSEILFIELKYPLIDEIVFYAPGIKNQYIKEVLDEYHNFSQRKINNPNPTFELKIPKDSFRTLYFKVKSNNELLMPIYIGGRQAIYDSELSRNLIYGIYFGIILGSIFYNLFLAFSVKDKSYLLYIIYILLVGISQSILGGYSFKYLWPDLPYLTLQSINIIPALNSIAVIEFFRQFINPQNLSKSTNRNLLILNAIYIVSISLSFLNYYNISYTIILVTDLIGSVYLIIISIKLSIKKYRQAKFFLIAWSFFLVSICIFVLRNFNVLPFNTFTENILLFGSAAEVTLLSFALADRINILKKEKETSQALALNESQRNEQLIRDQNITLEKKVGERTTQLSNAVQELNLTMDDLKNTQAQLVDSEKMASLGQLTAGIAHEINNPINFVTSNINPLKRDIYDVYKLLEHYENEAKSPELLKSATQLKKDLDIDYVKNEIDMLLKGIEEGANRTSEIIRGLKKFSRVDEQDIKEVNINEGFESTLLLLNSKIKDHIKLNLSFGELPMIECYAGKLNQVFMNIISNSIYAITTKFEDKPGGELSIITQLDSLNNKFIMIKIIDNGIGMPESTRARIFDPFFTTKPVGEGTGLGLSIVQKIISAHKGTIEVDSEQGKGTEFQIELPVRQ